MPENDKRDAEWFQSQPRTCPVCAGTAWDMVDIVADGDDPTPQSGFHAVQESARWRPVSRWQGRKSGFDLPEQRLRARCTTCDTILFIPLESTGADQQA